MASTMNIESQMKTTRGIDLVIKCSVSAYYMHRKMLAQLLEFARAVEGGGGDSNAESSLEQTDAHLKDSNGATEAAHA
ncbi:hypothetical protein VNO78_11483 [Psophocarpus tetragonolobus]|uniref:Uncharacterized protein n=1 Tax=Psophocarpus tetragonolobus TaxID=3891 RepID=A0AAN9STT0_PSOTE